MQTNTQLHLARPNPFILNEEKWKNPSSKELIQRMIKRIDQQMPRVQAGVIPRG